MPDFATVGDNCIDRYGPPIGRSVVGGNAVNVAVQLARLGCAAAYFGAIGDDADGRRTVSVLAANGVDGSAIRVAPTVTAYTEIAVDSDGERHMVHEEFGACAGYRPSAADLKHILGAGHVHIGWLNDGGTLRRRLVGEGVSVSQDISVNAEAKNRGVDGLDIAFASAGSDRARAEALIADLLKEGAKLAVVTCGVLGSLASDGQTRAEATIRAVPVVDTTGAGDSFIAGFLSARRGGKDLAACLATGRDVSAQTCTHLGGFPQPA
ncbi:MAG: fructoselysine 6-kinase [Hyphomicrobiales bacterium]|nr:fructoselysine 6-kinase [Hyphomicrobiales bacterium]